MHWGLFWIIFAMMMGAVLAACLAHVAIEYFDRHDLSADALREGIDPYWEEVGRD